ncbi:MAG: sigma-54-dependent Fis family transcriptional regulator [Planctomycetes bacterium]|nr:sigma-54-dependent Fis family transcriptional regulator [Planctomycetota bacterium]
MISQLKEAETKCLNRIMEDKDKSKQDLKVYLSEELKIEENVLTDKAINRYVNIPLHSKQFRKQLKYLANSESTVIIQGATGTGKGVIAELIHFASKRREGRFERLNLSGYPLDLGTGLILGHTADAFTGPKAGKLGSYVLAHNGTLFIDEFENINTEMQVLFLDITQRTGRRLRRIGSTRSLLEEILDRTSYIDKDLNLRNKRWLGQIIKDIRNDIRNGKSESINARLLFGVITNLKERVEANEFRQDLYYRINVTKIVLPDLKDWVTEDIQTLIGQAIDDFDKKNTINGFCPKFLQRLKDYKWPGNIRQLRNVIQASIVYSNHNVIKYNKWLETPFEAPNLLKDNVLTKVIPKWRDLPEDERLEHLISALNETIEPKNPEGNCSKAKRKLKKKGACEVSVTTIAKTKKNNIRIVFESGKYKMRK